VTNNSTHKFGSAESSQYMGKEDKIPH